MTIQNALSNYFGNKYKTYKGDIGLEIETETTNPYDIPRFSFWNSHVDNSLRGFGMEYTLRQPLDFEVTFPKALEEFDEKTKNIAFIKDSITTSVHVHLNFLNDNFVTLGNFLTLYSMNENLLIRASGEDRLSNLFCLPICDAEEIHQNMLHMFRGIREKKYGNMNFVPEQTKYGALNLSSLQQFGSLEIRSFRGTTDTKLIKDWVGTLHTLQKYARTPGLVPPQIILNYKEKKTEYLTDIFGEYRKFVRHSDEEALIEKNFWYAAALAYEIKDWTKLEQVIKPKKVRSKDLDKISNALYGRNFENLGDTGLQQAVIRQAERGIDLGEEEREEYVNPMTGLNQMMTFTEYQQALRERDRQVEGRRTDAGERPATWGQAPIRDEATPFQQRINRIIAGRTGPAETTVQVEDPEPDPWPILDEDEEGNDF